MYTTEKNRISQKKKKKKKKNRKYMNTLMKAKVV